MQGAQTHTCTLAVEQPRRALYRQCAHVTDLNRPPYMLAVLSSRYPIVNPYMLQTMIDSYDMYTVVQELARRGYSLKPLTRVDDELHMLNYDTEYAGKCLQRKLIEFGRTYRITVLRRRLPRRYT